jgi:site-specific DNA-methyltransferase (adenine-specific)
MSRVEHIGRATLYLGDCRDILPTLPKVDAVVTDPPYGIGASFDIIRHKHSDPSADWDASPPSDELIQAMVSAGRECVIWGGNYFVLPPSRCWLAWTKPDAVQTAAGMELAWTNLDRNSRFKMVSRNQPNKQHPTQKPLELMRWCLGFLSDAQTILDPFMGSGTTGVAAIQTGRNFVGIERDERYFEEACRRLREANGDDVGPLFGEAA